MSDEGVHEIQLNGKQLVFMFMAVTVVAVVIFLCGVMVGRGVRAPRATEQADAAIEVPSIRRQRLRRRLHLRLKGPADSRSGSAQEQLTYPDRLSDDAHRLRRR